MAGRFLHLTVDPSIACAHAVEDCCTIQVLRIAAKEDTQGLEAAATGIIRDPNMAMGYAWSFSRHIVMKSR